MFSPQTVAVLAVALIIGSLFKPLESNSQFARQTNADFFPATVANRALLVTAHPDDEAMFFAPTILALNKPGAPVSLFHLCLSTGNAEGLGSTRRDELSVSLDVLGFPRNKRWIVDRPELPDNITLTWDSAAVAKVLKPFITDLKIDTVLTFDDDGISDHPNHKAIPAGVRALQRQLSQDKVTPPRLYGLESASLPAKYSSFFAVPFAKLGLYGYSVLSGYESLVLQVAAKFIPDLLVFKYPKHPDGKIAPLFVSGASEYLTAVSAMRAHQSQLEWFRYLYITFSEYMWVNSWKHMPLEGEEV